MEAFNLLNKFKNIGFEYINTKSPVKLLDEIPTHPNKDDCDVIVNEYRYYPSYFTDQHYTLVLVRTVVTYLITQKRADEFNYEFRLYIYSNLDGKCLKSIFQTQYIPTIEEIVNDLFQSELRDSKLREIGI